MSIPRSPLPISNMDSENPTGETLKCPSCQDFIQPQSQSCCIIEICQHIFHRVCIEHELSNSAQCPLCKITCELSNLKAYPATNVEATENSTQTGTIRKNRSGYRGKGRGNLVNRPITRNLSKTFGSESLNYSTDFDIPQNNPPEVGEDSTSQNPPSNNPSIPNRNLPNTTPIQMPSEIDYSRINQMIENNIIKIFQNLNLGTSIPNPNVNSLPNHTAQNGNPLNQIPPQQILTNENRNFSNQTPTSEVSLPLRPDRVTFIIQNWNIHFDGSNTNLPVEEFLYRIKMLTKEHLQNNFSHICKNLPIILTGKAREWYWRYHKSVESIQWNEFCSALRSQFKDLRSNFDLMEAIRNRKMKSGESFDSFYDSICSIADRLKQPIPEEEMVEILVRNLRPDIRHELLYVPIFTIAHLRKLVQMRENLMGDEFFKKSQVSKPPAPNNYNNVRRNVAEVQYDVELTHENNSEACVDAINKDPSNVKCWNCDGFGHFWDDCLKDRKVFCYGCGLKNVYKPQCTRCANRKIAIQSKNYVTQKPNSNPP